MSTVDPGMPAAAAGVRVGDLLVEVAGHVLSNGDDFKHYLPTRDSDQAVEVGLWRRRSDVAAPTQRVITSTMRDKVPQGCPPWMPPTPQAAASSADITGPAFPARCSRMLPAARGETPPSVRGEISPSVRLRGALK